MTYELSTRRAGKIMVVDIQGQFLESASWHLVEFINLFIRNKELQVLVNLEKAGWIDPESLGAVRYGHVEITRRGGKFAVVGNSLLRLLLESKGEESPQSFDSEKEALAWFSEV